MRSKRTRTGVALMRDSLKRARHARTRIGDNGRCTRLTLFSEGVTPLAISKTRKDGVAHIINFVSQEIGRDVRSSSMTFPCYQ